MDSLKRKQPLAIDLNKIKDTSHNTTSRSTGSIPINCSLVPSAVPIFNFPLHMKKEGLGTIEATRLPTVPVDYVIGVEIGEGEGYIAAHIKLCTEWERVHSLLQETRQTPIHELHEEHWPLGLRICGGG